MIYSIERSKKAAKYFGKSDKSLQNWFFKKVSSLQENPCETNTGLDIKPMEGARNIYRLRIGDYRLVYEVYHETLVILFVNINSRGDIYKRR